MFEAKWMLFVTGKSKALPIIIINLILLKTFDNAVTCIQTSIVFFDREWCFVMVSGQRAFVFTHKWSHPPVNRESHRINKSTPPQFVFVFSPGQVTNNGKLFIYDALGRV